MSTERRFVVIRGTGRDEWDRWHDASHWTDTEPLLSVPFVDGWVTLAPTGETETNDEGVTAAVWAPVPGS